ncbi:MULTISPECIES: glycosyl transferase [Nitrosomonas]|uniref:Possible glycosyltransferase n=1 Tax=Nitrosomonas europaea (strain ATCC 19718 / CIP 103999 / KCTC 2705 / NBRC 14298) TaxID=228410 RepID=Q82X13_NITEU|nr:MULTISPECIES: glycosyl transferase [Nitrosomonas]CAD84398.1 possible glycosyltransferase [Nitrosomonas europaea ATCC 19718]SDW77546.1 Glycosyltransferase involved in cell wall bisynthesis [Nitrosomonas europaea]SES98118.1 Glycosyltransferase involved in cell wall bisynthesis [Nitrosomonas europaea]SJZ48579.1 Glycosyltransferase involved in cell wall bisynthesis [Nitrosomonas europaea]HBF24636.1 glycosyl transferase [Nitrosomonas sp.]
MQLIYLSPVPWASFAQRPHKFVEWFHGRTGGSVFWVDPYPTRFPLLSDFQQFIGKAKAARDEVFIPAWLNIIKPVALPIEPLPSSGTVNIFLWRRLLQELSVFAASGETLLVIGKPSIFALTVMDRLNGCRSIYDVMDDFPSFYSGLSRFAMQQREKALVRQVSVILTSSTTLKHRWSIFRNDVELVHNGLDLDILPPLRLCSHDNERKVLGYVGTIAAWFDWEWVIVLANVRPQDIVRLIGPVFSTVPAVLPQNIEILPPCNHQAALLAMQEFDVGLIPFKKILLTESVDPIKYYEYRALGLPVLSTDFGEMALRKSTDGTYLSRGVEDVGELAALALQYHASSEVICKFREFNSWKSRFDNAGII